MPAVTGAIPYLLPRRVRFPPVESALSEPNGLLAAGGDLEPETLLRAYSLGIFPWYNAGDPILWWHPDPRMVIFPGRHRVNRSLRAAIRSGRFEVSADREFDRVVAACAEAPRPGQPEGSWITAEMRAAYARLHRMGHAHSVEAWAGGELAGGLYGVAIGACFFGESMFHRAPDASKVALAALSSGLAGAGYALIDCQVASPHLARMGGTEIPRRAYVDLLARSVPAPADPGVWARDLRPGAEAGPPPARRQNRARA